MSILKEILDAHYDYAVAHGKPPTHIYMLTSVFKELADYAWDNMATQAIYLDEVFGMKVVPLAEMPMNAAGKRMYVNG